MENQSKISPKSWRDASWHLLLFLAILTAGIALPYTHAHAKKLQLQDLIVLKQVGYSDTQLVDEIKKSGMTGKFALTPKQVLKLRKEGFSIAIIRMMGIKKAVISKPVSLSEMQRWLKQKKPTAWMRAQLTRRGIVKQQFGTFTILQLSRLGLPMSLLKLLHQLKQKKPSVRTKPTPPVRRQPPTPRPKDDPNKLLKDLPLVPSFPFETPSPARRTPPQTRTKPTPSTNTKQPPKVTRWGTQRTHAAPLSPRKKRIANRKGTLVTLPANRVYTHIGHYYSLKIPKGWNVYEDVNPDGGDLDVYITPDAEPHIRRLKRGIAITISYLPHNDRFLLTRSLKQISLFALQEYLGSEPKVGEIKPLTATTFQKKKALDVLLEGKEQTHTNELRAKWTFVRHKNTIIQVAYFAEPFKFKAFAKQVDKHLTSFAFLDPLKHHRKKRLLREASVQSLIQKNTKSVVSISVLRKRKGKKSFVASGTGFVITQNGYVLTNHHVAINRTTGKPYSKYILNWDRSTGLKSVEAHCVAAHFKYPQWRRSRTIDSKTGRISVKYILQHVDIALLKIKTPGTYQPVKLSPIKSAMLGDTVIAMGFPLEGSGIQNLGNEDITATTGRISRFVRMGDRMVNEIQHTAKVAGGNSGGPLLDVHTGGVIGINTWVGIFDKRLPRPAMGLGYYYALPINLAWQFFPDYVNYPQDKLTHLQWYELGSKWLAKGQYAPAKRAFLRVIKKKPSFIPAYAQLATLYTRRAHKYHNDKRDKYMKVARRWADRGLKRDLAHPRLMQLLAQITISQKEWMTTRYLISKMLKADPNKWSTYLLRAQMYNKQKKYNLALNDAYSVIELAGSLLPIGHSTRGWILYSAKRYFEGQQAYRQALQIDPSNLEAKLGEAMGYVYLKQYEDAISRLDTIAKQHPLEPDVYRAMMLAYISKRQVKPAWKTFLKYFRICMIKHVDPHAFALYVGGLLARRNLPRKSADKLLWGLWGKLLSDHTRTSYAGRAGIRLALEAKRKGYTGLAYGLIKMLRFIVKEGKTQKRLNKLYSKLKPTGLSTIELFFILFRPIPRWPTEMLWRLFKNTPTVISKRTARFLYKKRVSPKLVLNMYLLSLKRAKKGMRPTRLSKRKSIGGNFGGGKGTARDRAAVIKLAAAAIKSIYRGDLKLWMSIHDPRGNRARYRRIFRNLSYALSKGRFAYFPSSRVNIKWATHPKHGQIARYYFKARFGYGKVKFYYWKLRKHNNRWYMW